MLFSLFSVLCIQYAVCQHIDGWASIDEKGVITTSGPAFRCPQWFVLMKEANEKFHFPPGNISFVAHDYSTKANFSKKTYFSAYEVDDVDIFRPVTGPDWTSIGWFGSMTEFRDMTYLIVEASMKTPKYDKVGWNGNFYPRGNGRTGPFNRPLLKNYSSDYPDYFHFQHTSEIRSAIPMNKLVEEYAYLLDIEGSGYSGRLKYLMYSNRPILYVERHSVEWFNEQLKPWIHYVPVKDDLSDLVTKYKWLVDNPEKAAVIAGNALEFAGDNLNHDAFIDKVGEVVTYLLEQSH